VISGYVRFFIDEAYAQTERDGKDLQNSILHSTAKINVNDGKHQKGPFSKIMWAMNEVYPQFND